MFTNIFNDFQNLPTYFVILRIINIVLINLVGIFYLNQIFYLIASMFAKKKTFKEASKNHKYGFVISARNEELVIGQLIDSIKRQNYSSDLYNIFVIADNCTDNTAHVAKEAGAIVFERFDQVNKGKSFALDYLFNKIRKDNRFDDIEAFIIFDADNLLDKNYLYEMNKAYDSGLKAFTSYRGSKNFSDSWVAGSSSYMYYRECREIHRVRADLNIGTYVSGTGFLIDRSIIEKNKGWIHHTLVEDIEFSTDAAIEGLTIGYCEDAKFYDEQPRTLAASLRQRLRWCKGTHQIFFKYNKKLTKSFFHKFNFAKWDLFAHSCPLPFITFTWTILYGILAVIGQIVLGLSYNETYSYALRFVFGNIGIPLILALINALVLMVQVWNKIHACWFKKILYACTFPIFMLFYLPLSCIALFKKVTWKEVKHDCSTSIEDIEKKINNYNLKNE